jgi:hypothetical protein
MTIDLIMLHKIRKVSNFYRERKLNAILYNADNGVILHDGWMRELILRIWLSMILIINTFWIILRCFIRNLSALVPSGSSYDPFDYI